MSLKKVELYRGFNIYAEEVRVGAWRISVVEIPSSEARDPIRPPSQGRVPGDYQSRRLRLPRPECISIGSTRTERTEPIKRKDNGKGKQSTTGPFQTLGVRRNNHEASQRAAWGDGTSHLRICA
jgi:hypothetical protein